MTESDFRFSETRLPPSLMPVQTLDKVKDELTTLKKAKGLRWSDISQKPEYVGIPAGTLCSIAKGRDPKNPYYRAILHLSVLVPTPVCPIHGVVHPGECPKEKKPAKKRYPKIAIRLDNPESAAQTIIAHMSAEDAVRLARLLMDETFTI